MERDSARVLGWALVGAGALYAVAEFGLVRGSVSRYALVVVALLFLFHLARTVDPAWLLSAGIVSTMFAGRWDDLGLGSSFGPHRVLLAAGLLALLLRAPPARDRPSFHLDGAHLALAAALAYALFSGVVAGTLGEENARFRLLDQYGALPFIMFTVAPVAFATHRQRMILLGSLVAVGGYLSVTAVLEKLHLYGLLLPRYIADPAVGIHFGRARGPFVEAAADGLALYACAISAAIAFFVWRRPPARAAAAAVVVLAPVSLLLTETRGAWIAGIAGTLVALTTTAHLRRFLVPVAAVGVVGVLAALALIPGLSENVGDRQKDKGPVYERRNTNAAGLRMLADQPFLGFGWEQANAHMEPYFRLHPDIPLNGAMAGLHDVYLQYAVELGVVGFGLWLLAMALTFGRALGARAPPDIAPWQAGLKGIAIAWLVVGLFSPAHYAFTTFLVWTWAGVVYRRPAYAPARIRSSLREGAPRLVSG